MGKKPQLLSPLKIFKKPTENVMFFSPMIIDEVESTIKNFVI